MRRSGAMMTDEEARRVLGVGLRATAGELREARRRLLLEYHPDHNPGREAWAARATRGVLEAFARLAERPTPPAAPPPHSAPQAAPADRLREFLDRQRAARQGPATEAPRTRPATAAAPRRQTTMAASPEVPFVLFSVDSRVFALPVSSVVEVVRAEVGGLSDQARSTNAHPFVVGRMRFRDAQIPVVDLSAALGLEASSSGCDHVVVVDWRSARLGVAVSRVHEVTQVRPSAIEPPPPELAQMRGCVRGVFARGTETVYVPHLEALVALGA